MDRSAPQCCTTFKRDEICLAAWQAYTPASSFVLFLIQVLFRAAFALQFAPCKGIRIPESRNFLLVESGILGFGIRNPALRIRNPTKDWNPESNLLKIHSRLNLATRSKEKPAVYEKPPEGIDLNVTT